MPYRFETHRPRWPAPSVACLALGVVLAFGLGGCAAIGKPIGRGALAGAQSYVRTEPGRDSVRAMIDTLLAHTGRSSQPVLDTATTRLLAKAQLALDTATSRLSAAEERALLRTRDSLTAVLRGEWSDAIAKLARSGVRGAGDQGSLELARLVLAFRGTIMPHLDSAVSMAAAHAIDSISSRFAMRLSGDLRAGLVLVADTVARVGARAAVQAAGTTAPQTPLWQRITKIAAFAIGGLILAALILAAAWLYRERKRNEEMLSVVTEEIHRSGDNDLKSRIKMRATQRKIEGALRTFLIEHDLLDDPAPPASKGSDKAT